MKLTRIFGLFILLSALCVVNKNNAQVPRYIRNLINLDSIAQNMGMPVLISKEVYIFPTQTRHDSKYLKMLRNFMKVYPIALQIKEEFVQIEADLKVMNPRQQRKYMDLKDKELKRDYKKTLMKLTLSQSIMLVKLIDRETGNTSYQLIKDLRGSITAFFWQNIALLFNNNLKAKYDPDGDDKDIEMLVKRYEAGTL
ncbi:MAG TPA: DUF4294 domain-containing protein [Bacteroidales bacterium]|nr:DUF4294 domain-containing protein [Bacteroidales bacterium]HQL70038.1 DUF4294 domain-containing protein [Bacteroidales bacterium]